MLKFRLQTDKSHGCLHGGSPHLVKKLDIATGGINRFEPTTTDGLEPTAPMSIYYLIGFKSPSRI